MNKLDISLKAFNLSFTNTVERDSSTRNGYDFNKIEVNKDDCISLYDLINSFNKMHLSFLEDYRKLEKLKLGREIDVKGFTVFKDTDGGICRVLDLYISKPTMIDHDYTYLYLREIDGVTMPFISNERGSFLNDNGYYRKNIRLNDKKVKQYLDLFEKYELLFELYNYLKSQVVYGDGTFLLLTRIDSNNNSFLDEMDSFRVTLIANHEIDSGDTINIKINLGNELGIDLDNSRIKLGNEDITIDNEKYFDILKNIYVYGRYLEKHNKNEKQRIKNENVKVKKLINHI